MENWNKDGLEAALLGEDWLVDSRDIEHAIQFCSTWELGKGM